jgi:hypothetical protein
MIVFLRLRDGHFRHGDLTVNLLLFHHNEGSSKRIVVMMRNGCCVTFVILKEIKYVYYDNVPCDKT